MTLSQFDLKEVARFSVVELKEAARVFSAMFPDEQERRKYEMFRVLAPAVIASEPTRLGKMEAVVALMRALESDYGQ